MEPFSVIEETPERQLYDKFEQVTGGLTADHDIQYQATLQKRFPELRLTAIPTANCNLLAFAAAGHATAELDTTTDPVAGWRGYLPRYGKKAAAGIVTTTFFAKYHYRWGNEDFMVFVIGGIQYVLKEPAEGETAHAPIKSVDKLILAAGEYLASNTKTVWVFDDYWRSDPGLWKSVEKASWDKVILDDAMKKDLADVANKFFDNEDVYEGLGVPWKRGLIFHGPPGNGKTISIKALMHTLHDRARPIPSLYVKSAINKWMIDNVFNFARVSAPCMLIFEDVETIVTPATRSYFLNQVDGLENNDGILMVASTNFLDRLDPGITKRPSRFDRKYLFPMPNKHERTLYAEFWRRKLDTDQKSRVKVDFPQALCPAMAEITNDFSFAYMQEAFISTLLTIARENIDIMPSDKEKPESPFLPSHATFRPSYPRSAASQALYAALNPHESARAREYADLDKYQLWRVFKESVRTLRGDMDNSSASPTSSDQEILPSASPVSPLSRRSKHANQPRSPHSLSSMTMPYRAAPPQSFDPSTQTLAMHGMMPAHGVARTDASMPGQRDQVVGMTDIPSYGSAGYKAAFFNSTAFQWLPVQAPATLNTQVARPYQDVNPADKQ